MLNILSIVEKVEAVQKAVRDFNIEFQKSSKDVKRKISSVKLLDDLSISGFDNEVNNWADDIIDELQEVESYCVCKKENLEIDCEETFFYTAKVNFREDTVKFTDEIGPPHGQQEGITFKQYQEHFFEVPKEVYDFYMFLGNEGRSQEDYVKMVEEMYNL